MQLRCPLLGRLPRGCAQARRRRSLAQCSLATLLYKLHALACSSRGQRGVGQGSAEAGREGAPQTGERHRGSGASRASGGTRLCKGLRSRACAHVSSRSACLHGLLRSSGRCDCLGLQSVGTPDGCRHTLRGTRLRSRVHPPFESMTAGLLAGTRQEARAATVAAAPRGGGRTPAVSTDCDAAGSSSVAPTQAAASSSTQHLAQLPAAGGASSDAPPPSPLRSKRWALGRLWASSCALWSDNPGLDRWADAGLPCGRERRVRPTHGWQPPPLRCHACLSHTTHTPKTPARSLVMCVGGLSYGGYSLRLAAARAGLMSAAEHAQNASLACVLLALAAFSS